MEKIVRFFCKECGKSVEIIKYKFSGNLCRRCKMKRAYADKEKVEKINEKRRQTNLIKYGVDNPQKNETIKEKTKNTKKPPATKQVE